MSRSLTARLLRGTVLATMAICALLGTGIYLAVRRTLTAEFDGGLLARAEALQSMVEQRRDHVHFEFDPAQMPEYASGHDTDFFQLWVDGKPFARSPSLGMTSLTALPDAGGRAAFHPLTLPGGHPGRMLVLHFRADADNDDIPANAHAAATLVVARRTRGLDRTMGEVLNLLLTLCGGAIFVSAAALLIIVRRAMKPVMSLARQIERLDEAALDTPLAAADIPTELAPVIERLNGLLARLNDAFVRERAFTADVAHELRTPIAALVTTLQVSRARPRESPEYVRVIDKSLDILGSMRGLIENLLLLARAEGGQLQTTSAPLDLDAAIRESLAAFENRLRERHVTLEVDSADGVRVCCDPMVLGILLNNIFDNAATYVDAGGTVRVSVAASAADPGGIAPAPDTAGPDGVQLRVANSGTLIDAADIPRLFERFWRKDTSRSQTGLHAGLGLSLCQRLLKLENGDIHITSAPGQDFVVTITLPRAGEWSVVSCQLAAPLLPRSRDF